MSDLSNPKSSVESSSMSELPHGWAWASLNELSSLINGDRGRNYPSKSELFNSGIPFINAGHILDGKIDFSRMNYIAEEHFNLLGGGKIQCNDILYCLRGSLGKTALITDTGKGSIASSLVVIRPLKNSDPKYLYYFLVSPFGKDEISKHDNGSAQPNLSAANVGLYCIPVSPLNEQRRIVTKLDSLFTRSRRAREELERIPKLCDRYKQAILAAAFRGDLTADWREHNSSTWATVPLSELCLSITDGDHQAPPKVENGIPFITISAINDGSLRLGKATRFVSSSYFESRSPQRKPEQGDILFSVTGSIGIPVIVHTSEPFTFQRHIGILKVNRKLMIEKYLLHILGSEQIKKQALDVATGTAQLTIPLGGLRRFQIPFPTLEEQKEIVRQIEKLFKVIDLMRQEYQKASKLCDRLEQATLSKAFRGELVPQDPNDEPASTLLERILAERQEQPKSKAVKSKQKPGEQS